MLSNRGKYATRALLDLTLHYGDGPVLIQDIAERQNIPLKFLEQILLALKQAGFVSSRKGRGGGYYLSRQPALITLGEVVRVVDGPLAPVSCVSITRYSECGCPDPLTCGLRRVWQDARDALAGVLDQTTFADIADRHQLLEAHQAEGYDYAI